MLNLAGLLDTIFSIFYLLLIARIIFSFIPLNQYKTSSIGRVYQIVWSITEPVLKPFRRIIPPTSVSGGSYIDFSPILALLALNLIQAFIIRNL